MIDGLHPSDLNEAECDRMLYFFPASGSVFVAPGCQGDDSVCFKGNRGVKVSMPSMNPHWSSVCTFRNSPQSLIDLQNLTKRQFSTNI